MTLKFCELEEEKERTDNENEYLKKKEKQFNMALQEKVEMQLKLDDQITKLNRATRQNRELETTIKIINADNT